MKMIKHYKNIEICSVGEHRKRSAEYTNYDYIELKNEHELFQLRDVIVHDAVNAGLCTGSFTRLVVAEITLYSNTTLSETVSEMIMTTNAQASRCYFANLIDQLKKQPALYKLLPWILLLPVRTFMGCLRSRSRSPFGALMGSLTVTYFSIFLAPIVAPVTFIKRRKKYRELTRASAALTNSLHRENISKDILASINSHLDMSWR